MKFWLGILIFLFSFGALAKIIVSSDPYPPLIYLKKGVPAGTVTDILPLILDKPASELTYRFSPWKRVLLDAEKGSVDIVGPLLITAERSRFLVFTEPLIRANISLWVRRDNPKVKELIKRNQPIKDFRELGDLTFGQILGYAFGEDFGAFFNRPEVRKVEVVDMGQGVRMLTSKRIDVFLAYSPVIEYYIGELKLNKGDFYVLGEANREVMYVMGVSKKSSLVKELPKINQRIIDLKILQNFGK
ncbi:ABC transporter substrate-binding protein [Bdellovibrio sp. KM01]|uniref:substrate-binding periplasmic protein n=1 Tax=Bdellovibrio sp. KM01 TaxID=2748865 RepID=UPI0015EABE85|nr:transporter substrate-binding domain-containing protein [Bdellovibrio sp. KM01]QLY25821.1 transporter substrate-binding domain-containing protein [Bdellovibrio sp. KM01]